MAWLYLTLPEQGKLFSQEQILCYQGNTKGNEQSHERQQFPILQEPVSAPAVVGTFLFHCQILEHEDVGMMGTVTVK